MNLLGNLDAGLVVFLIFSAFLVGGIGGWLLNGKHARAQQQSALRRMPLMINPYIIAGLAIVVVFSVIWVTSQGVELNDWLYGGVGSILTMLTMAFTKVLETNIFLVRRSVGEADDEDEGD